MACEGTDGGRERHVPHNYRCVRGTREEVTICKQQRMHTVTMATQCIHALHASQIPHLDVLRRTTEELVTVNSHGKHRTAASQESPLAPRALCIPRADGSVPHTRKQLCLGVGQAQDCAVVVHCFHRFFEGCYVQQVLQGVCHVGCDSRLKTKTAVAPTKHSAEELVHEKDQRPYVCQHRQGSFQWCWSAGRKLQSVSKPRAPCEMYCDGWGCAQLVQTLDDSAHGSLWIAP
mmetsp:Transcript_9072/g.25337  ORF Transcript_9072/g.25337 Transcript_9072/m.25337 type:complete len:232 (+) Transcript_9072:953-1648(+)